MNRPRKSFLRRLALSLLTSQLLIHAAHASLLSEVLSCAGLVMEIPFKKMMAPIKGGSQLRLQKLNGDLIHFQLGRSLGQGWVGLVLEVQSIRGQSTPLDGLNVDLVVKFPNQLKGLSQPVSKAEKEIKSEAELYLRLRDQYSKIVLNERFPKFSGWGRTPPVVPIIGYEETMQGPFILKPKIPAGSFAKDIAKLYVTNGYKLPPEMIESLFQFFEFSQIAGKTLGIWPDVRPANLVWIHDQKTMRMMNFSRPSFAAIELSGGLFPLYSEPFNSFSGFLREFENILRLELIKSRF